MIRFERGDILTADAEALVNTVNCVGVMGRGIALQFKNRFPANYKAYRAACDESRVQPGTMFVFDRREVTWPRYIINFPTKRHWRGKSRIEDIESGMESLVREIRSRGIKSIAIPPLGSGLGGLRWTDVRPVIETALKEIPDVDVVVYEPGGTGSEVSNRSTQVPTMTAGRSALVVLMHRYLAGLLDPSISLLEVHKLMYFLQIAGEPLRLRFVKGPYGPYAENLRHVLQKVEGHLVSGYASGGDAPTKQLTIVPGAVTDAERFLTSHEETNQRFARVSRLVEGYESPFGLELLATVLWVVQESGTRELPDVETATHAWGARKLAFSRAQIGLALERLADEGWIDSIGSPS
jgi:O-acetyl-ADP-ribose deacetylase (regulator of RNase III)